MDSLTSGRDVYFLISITSFLFLCFFVQSFNQRCPAGSAATKSFMIAINVWDVNRHIVREWPAKCTQRRVQAAMSPRLLLEPMRNKPCQPKYWWVNSNITNDWFRPSAHLSIALAAQAPNMLLQNNVPSSKRPSFASHDLLLGLQDVVLVSSFWIDRRVEDGATRL